VKENLIGVLIRLLLNARNECLMVKLELFGWRQVSPNTWSGAVFTNSMFDTQAPERAWIKIKKSSGRRGGYNVTVYTSYGNESGHGSTLEDAFDRVKFFMERRPQNVPEANRNQRLFGILSTPGKVSVQQGDVVIEKDIKEM
jgi:hypothetical protein